MYNHFYFSAYAKKNRKEMIQPLLPERLPCYDLVPIAKFTLVPDYSEVLGAFYFGGLTGGECKTQERIHRGVADPRLLRIPCSWGRVSAPNPH